MVIVVDLIASHQALVSAIGDTPFPCRGLDEQQKIQFTRYFVYVETQRSKLQIAINILNAKEKTAAVNICYDELMKAKDVDLSLLAAMLKRCINATQTKAYEPLFMQSFGDMAKEILSNLRYQQLNLNSGGRLESAAGDSADLLRQLFADYKAEPLDL